MNHLIPEFTNIFLDEKSHSIESVKDYLMSALSALSNLMGETFFDYDFYLFSNKKFSSVDTPHSATINTERPKVLIYVGEAYGSIPIPLMEKYLVIFKAYLPHDRSDNNIYPIPLPHSSAFYNSNLKPWGERKTNVFFSGKLLPSRFMGLYRALSLFRFFPSALQVRLPVKSMQYMGSNFSNRFKRSKVIFNKNQNAGLSQEDYQRLFFDSKIALCPKGYIAAETTRHFEAAAAGCIIISEKLPDTYLYRNSPIIQITNWRKELGMIKSLLRDEKQQLMLHKQTRNWYQENVMPYSLAKYMFNVINEKMETETLQKHQTVNSFSNK